MHPRLRLSIAVFRTHPYGSIRLDGPICSGCCFLSHVKSGELPTPHSIARNRMKRFIYLSAAKFGRLELSGNLGDDD
jgi:hypothetical protein